MFAKKIFFQFFSLLLLGYFFILPIFCLAVEKNIIINEIQTAGEKSNDEFIELYNPTSIDVDLAGFKLTKKTKSGTESTLLTSTRFSGIISYFLISHPDYFSIRPDLNYPASYYISNDYTLILYDKSGTVIDKVGYGNASDFESAPTSNPGKSKSIGRKNFIDTNNNLKDFSLFDNPTPGTENIEKIIPPEPPKIYSSKIRLNEILPKPLKSEEEFIELYNAGEKADLTDWRLEDRSKSKCELNGEIKAQEYFLVLDCKIKLNDTQGETLSLFDPEGKLISFLSYEGNAKESKSYNFDGSAWHWSQFLTPGEKNKFNTPPSSKTKKDKTIYVGVYANFQAKASDADNDKLKYIWDFGDGHKSYKNKTRHKYEKIGKYTITLKISDGNEDKIEQFKIQVKKYPKRKLEIIEISPNPLGKDYGNEYIILKNKDKKDINLNGWSIATGLKKLVNHPITKDLVIKKNETIKITQEFSKFTLNNKHGKIEVRYPNGKTASKIKYDKGGKSLAEDEVYLKINKIWQWQIPTKLQNALAFDAKPQTENTFTNSVDSEIAHEIIPENTKFLPFNSKIKYKLVNFASQIKPPKEILFEKDYHLFELESKYFFLSPLPEKKHYFLSFWKNFQAKINSLWTK